MNKADELLELIKLGQYKTTSIISELHTIDNEKFNIKLTEERKDKVFGRSKLMSENGLTDYEMKIFNGGDVPKLIPYKCHHKYNEKGICLICKKDANEIDFSEISEDELLFRFMMRKKMYKVDVITFGEFLKDKTLYERYMKYISSILFKI